MRSRMGAVAAVVALTVLSAPTAAHAQPSPSPSPDAAYDLFAGGIGLYGALGQIRRMSAQVQNLGPDSTTPPDVELSPKRLLEVQLPAGMQLVKDSTTICDAAIVQPPDPRRFNCLVPPLEPMGIKKVEFEVKLIALGATTVKVTTRAFGPGTDLDTNPANDTAELTITVVDGYDVMAVGASAHGKVGSVVELTVGVKNLGPTVMPPSVFPGVIHYFVVVLPVGVEKVEPTDICASFRHIPRPPPRGFNCITTSTVEPGESFLLSFQVRITGPVSGSGSVRRSTEIVVDLDHNPANDVAPITITTEELPQTGTDVKMIAAFGSGAVVLGGLLLLLLRPRRPTASLP